MKSDIIFDVLGNTSSFSLMGESSGYMITVNNSNYLLECGSPVFSSLGFNGLEKIKGIFATHSHEDHRRWFTDIVLFNYYDSKSRKKTRLISSELILEEFHKNSKGALERSLSNDSKRIVDIPYEEMVEEIIIGPRSKYFIALEADDAGGFSYKVKDRKGNTVGPEKAKIFINKKANRPRLLFKDDESGEWVEPVSYYPFSSSTFYEKNQNIFKDDDAELTVQAIKASVWHGVPTNAFKFTTPKSQLFFSADTVYKPTLWKELSETHREQKFDGVSQEQFQKQSVIFGDINDFIERTWSRERYEAAISAYKGSVVIHDVARKNSVVHTDYPDIAKEKIDNLIFTHSPDNLAAFKPILKSGKQLVVRGEQICESVNGTLFPFEADVYVKHFACDLVGFKSKKGGFKVIELDGLLGIVDVNSPGEKLMSVDLYHDVDGEYFPYLPDPEKIYRHRPDGKLEEVTFNGHSSSGKVVKGLRKNLTKNKKAL